MTGAIYEPLRFGVENYVPISSLTSNPEPVTDLEWLKDEWRANIVRYTDPSTDIVIEGTLESPQIGEYFALPGSNLVGLARIRLELFTAVDSTTDILNMDAAQVAPLTPLGQWRSGIDQYGVPRQVDTPGVFVYWFPKALPFAKWRLTISHTNDAIALATDVRLRMFMIGGKLQLKKSFSWGSRLRELTEPQLLTTASGSNVPSGRQVKSRAMVLDLKSMDDNDRMALSNMESVLNGAPFVVSAYPGGKSQRFNRYSFLGRFSNALEYTHNFHDANSSTLTIVEV